jgi:hypothetical protein
MSFAERVLDYLHMDFESRVIENLRRREDCPTVVIFK